MKKSSPSKPVISLIAAVARNGVIGVDNQLPWHIPEDLAYFKKTTLGAPIVSGRKNYESIGRPLPGRTNIILTRDSEYVAPGCVVVATPEQAIAAAGEAPEIFIIGGGEIYRLFFEMADRLYLTEIEQDVEGEITFPEVSLQEWQKVDAHDSGRVHKTQEGVPYRFCLYVRPSSRLLS
jgi:dihydrofolate reductase